MGSEYLVLSIQERVLIYFFLVGFVVLVDDILCIYWLFCSVLIFVVFIDVLLFINLFCVVYSVI